MQEIKKRRIVIASVLKPVDDTRMFEKIGLSLAHEYDVYIIGYPSKAPLPSTSVHFHSLPAFSRIGFKRIFASWKIFRKVLSVNPSVFIITTHELLIIAILAKWICGCKIIYDIQENYFRNILYTNAFPSTLRTFVAAYVRMKEWVTRPFVDHFFFAEKAYANEMPFLKRKTTVIENKYKLPTDTLPIQKTPHEKIHLLFSGTLSESTGVFNAITLARELYRHDPKIYLTIIGYCALQNEYERLLNEVNKKDYITLIGGNQLVPHHQIVQHIKTSDFGIVAYPKNLSTEQLVPTKLYEYLANELPILLINNPCWLEICKPFPAAVTVDFENINAAEILQKMQETNFYQAKAIDVYWETEEKKLFHVLNKLKIKI